MTLRKRVESEGKTARDGMGKAGRQGIMRGRNGQRGNR